MIANGKTAKGDWNWRTFGTGEGFTADLMTAGTLKAGLVKILGTDQFYWNADNLYIFDVNDESGSTFIAIGRYDGENYGIAYTTDGGNTFQTAIGFDGVHLTAQQVSLVSSGKVWSAPDETELLRKLSAAGVVLVENT